MKQNPVIASLFMVFFLLAQTGHAHSETCLHHGSSAGPYDEWGFPVDTMTEGDRDLLNAKDEMDLIYSLLTYSVVFKTWQSDSRDKNYRGHNYGSVLVNPQNEIAHWGRNESHACKDDTQHAETRAIQQFLKTAQPSSLKGYTIYVGGDSCPMCAGMISQQQISRAVIGLSNPFFGKNFDRMNLDSRECGNDKAHGLAPVVRQVKPVLSPSGIRKMIDQAYRAEVVKSCGSSLKECKNAPSQTEFLSSAKAHLIFEKAYKQFLNYKPKYPQEKAAGSKKTNEELYQEAVVFLKDKVS